MKNLITIFLALISFACTSSFTVKNKALLLSAEKFDQNVEDRAKASFVDDEQRKAFAEFLRKHSRLEFKSFDVKNETEAAGELEVDTTPKALDPEFAKVSGKEWDAKFKASVEKKTYPVVMKKTDLWKIDGLNF